MHRNLQGHQSSKSITMKRLSPFLRRRSSSGRCDIAHGPHDKLEFCDFNTNRVQDYSKSCCIFNEESGSIWESKGTEIKEAITCWKIRWCLWSEILTNHRPSCLVGQQWGRWLYKPRKKTTNRIVVLLSYTVLYCLHPRPYDLILH
jgi:hypothetical protein